MLPLLRRLAPALLLASLLPLPAAASRPNIILIFADDLGWRDVGWQGTDFYETPHLDKLAASGMVFTSGYAAAGNCAPSRACLLSGTYTPRHHVYAVQSTERGPKAGMRLVPIPNRSGLPRDNVTLAKALKSAGYVTGIFGKWHLDGPEGSAPSDHGFDTIHESYHGWHEAPSKDSQNPKGVFSLTRGALEFIERHRERPFFVYLPHYAIHTGLEARPETLARFQQKKPGTQHQHALYAACLYDLDASIGLLMARLAELGLDQNTLVVFTSDNGGTQQSSQEPLRGSKGGYYEGGIREPFVVRWPGVVAPGSRSDVPVINVDLFPTFLAAAGVPVPAGKLLDGESLLPLLRGTGSLARSSIYWHFPGYLNDPVIRGRDLDMRTGFRSRPVSVIRQGDWKLHLFHEEWQLDGGREKIATNGAVELYNLTADIGEHRNLAATEPARRDALLADLLAWIKSSGALLPTQRHPDYDPAAALAPAKKGKANKKQ
ncbi:MAG: sulfatase [Opitutaceae bacterium]|nr:sulfatase [Opitutaceae bacterium]